jgi:hypothetical protein
MGQKLKFLQLTLSGVFIAAVDCVYFWIYRECMKIFLIIAVLTTEFDRDFMSYYVDNV